MPQQPSVLAEGCTFSHRHLRVNVSVSVPKGLPQGPPWPSVAPTFSGPILGKVIPVRSGGDWLVSERGSLLRQCASATPEATFHLCGHTGLTQLVNMGGNMRKLSPPPNNPQELWNLLSSGGCGGYLQLCSVCLAAHCTRGSSLCGAETPATACPIPHWRISLMSLPKRKQPGMTMPVLSSAHPKEFRHLSAGLAPGQRAWGCSHPLQALYPLLGTPGKEKSNWTLLM